MAVTSASFLEAFPEFRPSGDKYPGLLEAKLAEARRRVDPTVYGEKTDDAVSYLAAHLMAVSPFGQAARLVAKDGSTVYNETFQQIKREVAAGPRVI